MQAEARHCWPDHTFLAMRPESRRRRGGLHEIFDPRSFSPAEPNQVVPVSANMLSWRGRDIHQVLGTHLIPQSSGRYLCESTAANIPAQYAPDFAKLAKLTHGDRILMLPKIEGCRHTWFAIAGQRSRTSHALPYIRSSVHLHPWQWKLNSPCQTECGLGHIIRPDYAFEFWPMWYRGATCPHSYHP